MINRLFYHNWENYLDINNRIDIVVKDKFMIINSTILEYILVCFSYYFGIIEVRTVRPHYTASEFSTKLYITIVLWKDNSIPPYKALFYE